MVWLAAVRVSPKPADLGAEGPDVEALARPKLVADAIPRTVELGHQLPGIRGVINIVGHFSLGTARPREVVRPAIPHRSGEAAHFCIVTIIQDVRVYARSHPIKDAEVATEEGMKEMPTEFVKDRGAIYRAI